MRAAPIVDARTAQTWSQTASEHCLPQWGMKPIVSDRRNSADLHILTLTHRGPPLVGYAAVGARRADVYQTTSSSFPTRVKDLVTLLVKSRQSISNAMGEYIPGGMYSTFQPAYVVYKTGFPRVFD
jgi:hypothetical protein